MPYYPPQKPTVPQEHTHVIDDVTGLINALSSLNQELENLNNITDTLENILASKVDDTDPRLSDAREPNPHGHYWNEILGKPSTFPPSAHGHTIPNIDGLAGELASKAALQHATQHGLGSSDPITIAQSQVFNLPSKLTSIDDNIDTLAGNDNHFAIVLNTKQNIVPLVTALPSNPANGDTVDLQTAAMAALGIVWRFRFRSGSASTYKWEFVGGPPWSIQEGATNHLITTANTWVTFAGASITPGFRGEYQAIMTALTWQSFATSCLHRVTVASSSQGAAEPVMYERHNAVDWFSPVTQTQKVEITNAAHVIQPYHFADATAPQARAGRRSVSIVPIRII